MKCKQITWLASIAMIFILAMNMTFAENIDPDNDGSQYAYGENIGWLNFEPSEGPGVHVSKTQLTGYVWAENIGWINLNPDFGGVVNDGTGILSGYAWGENVGWINFIPDYGGVTIDADGSFGGWAWGENIGWINFSSAQLFNYNVKVCKVNFVDLDNFLDDWLQSGASLPGDLSGNGEVDFVDYSIFADFWLDYCPDDWLL